MTDKEHSSEKQNLEKELEALKKDLGQLRHDLSDLKNSAETIGKDSFLHAADTVKGGWDEGLKDLEKCMDKHPACTVLTALSVGLIAGSILGLRR